MSYQSKYTGREIDNLLDSVKGVNVTKTVLFEGEFTTVGEFSEANLLSDSIYNYDLVYLTTYQKKSSSDSTKLRFYTIAISPEIVKENYVGTQANVMWSVNNQLGGETPIGYYMEGNFGDGTQLSIGIIKTETASADRIHGICRVEGIKFLQATKPAKALLNKKLTSSSPSMAFDMNIKYNNGFEVSENNRIVLKANKSYKIEMLVTLASMTSASEFGFCCNFSNINDKADDIIDYASVRSVDQGNHDFHWGNGGSCVVIATPTEDTELTFFIGEWVKISTKRAEMQCYVEEI